METLTEIKHRFMMAKARMDSMIIRGLLCRWVSEFEPSVAYYNGEILGLCVVGDPTGTIHVRVWDLRPELAMIADRVADNAKKA